MKKGIYNYSLFLTILLIIVVIFKDKYISVAPSLNVSIGLFIYALTFLIPVLIYNRTNINKAKASIKNSAMMVFIFYLFATLLCNITGNTYSEDMSSSLRDIFTPNNIEIFKMMIYYPDLLIIGFLLIYGFSHYILVSVYEAISTFYNTYISFAIAIFVAFIIDTMFTTPFWQIINIFSGSVGITDIIRNLTANFMVMMWSSIALVLVFPLFYDSEKGD